MADTTAGVDAAREAVDARIAARDREARARAVDPRFNVALEASAGTGKTRVLVDRYVNLLRAGVDPINVLAMTFTRKAAAEMRERIVASLRAAAERGEIAPSRWRELRERTGDISISTIDAFCLSLVREFPLEAGVDPGFSMADDTEVPRLVDESLDRTLRICRAVAREDAAVGLVFAHLGERRARAGLTALLHRRVVAPAVLDRYLSRGPAHLTVSAAAGRAAGALVDLCRDMRGGLERFAETGPDDPLFRLLVADLSRLEEAAAAGVEPDPARVQAAYTRARDYFLTADGAPRSRLAHSQGAFFSTSDWRTHRDLVVECAPALREADRRFRRDLNVLVSRGVRRMFAIAESEYRRTLRSHAVLDFSEVLLRTLDLLRQMEEFSQSRYRLEARYHHVLVDEFQDTSRAQWELVSLLVQSWGEGAGLSHTGPLPPSIFVVGDRKQSIYGFRDADVSVLAEAGRYLEGLRPDPDVRRTISRSFRAVPPLLAFVNDVCDEMPKQENRSDGFRFGEEDRFLPSGADADPPGAALGIVSAATTQACADAAAAEIGRLLDAGVTIRDRDTGVRRPVRPGDIAILFRTRESHREYEAALERRRIPAYVYKGLGFFDADEIMDVLALLGMLAEPESDLRAAAWMRSRVVGISDDGLRRLAPRLAQALRSADAPAAAAALGSRDAAALAIAREAMTRWSGWVDRVPPAEVLDLVLRDAAYAMTLAGPRFVQARENLKKMRSLIRRIQNRGYATMPRIAAHLDRLALGDEANAVIDAVDAVNLMTVHAAKGLEFPVVFVVNLTRGSGSRRDPIRVTAGAADAASVAVGDFRSDSDDEEESREREETKRLAYVALTRARDLLYLGSTAREGRLHPARGSLAEVLPASLLAMLGPTEAEREVTWTARSGGRHRFHVCPAPDDGAHAAGGDPAPGESDRRGHFAGHVDSDYAPLVDTSTPRRSVAAALAGETRPPVREAAGTGSSRLLGTIVHRLIQRLGLDPDVGYEGPIASIAGRLVRSEEAGDADPLLPRRAAALYRSFCARADVRALLASGDAFHEVPFTLLTGEGCLRGTIDCLVRNGDRVTVIDFKTGRPDAADERQIAIYRRAVEAVFPGCTVDTRIVHAAEDGG